MVGYVCVFCLTLFFYRLNRSFFSSIQTVVNINFYDIPVTSNCSVLNLNFFVFLYFLPLFISLPEIFIFCRTTAQEITLVNSSHFRDNNNTIHSIVIVLYLYDFCRLFELSNISNDSQILEKDGEIGEVIWGHRSGDYYTNLTWY